MSCLCRKIVSNYYTEGDLQAQIHCGVSDDDTADEAEKS